MKTLYKNSRLIAAAIVGTFVFSAGAALALSHDGDVVSQAPTPAQVENVGRFVVTPNTVKFVAPVKVIGRFVVTQHAATFVPAVV